MAKTSASRFNQARKLVDRYRDPIVNWTLALVLLSLVIGSFVRPVGNGLEGMRFAGPALLVAVALLILDSLKNRETSLASDLEVVERSAHLLEYFREALNSKEFSITFAGYSGETLYALLDDCYHEIEEGRTRVQRVNIRMLIPDCSLPLAIPCRADDLQDFESYRLTCDRRSDEFVGKIERATKRLVAKGVISGGIQVRYHHLPPVVKAYVINHDTAFLGLYPIEPSVFTEADGSTTATFDAKGTRAAMFGVTTKGTAAQRALLDSVGHWIETVWNTVAREEKRF